MSWIEVAVGVPRSLVEAAGDVLFQLCPQGFWESAGARPGWRRLRAYLPAAVDGRARLNRLRRTLGKVTERFTVQTRVVRDAEWATAWKAFARPVRIGHLIVQPTWLPVRPDRGHPGPRRHDGGESRPATVRLDPGMAFGSGEHPSTQLCLAAIHDRLQPGASVIDIGTGSGILAIAAARMGAGRVLAIDTDPLAVTVARANVRRNRVATRIRVQRGAGLRGVQIRADLILANLTADILAKVVGDVSRCLKPGGRLVASGFGSARVSEVRRHIGAAGLHVVTTARLRGWCAVHAVTPRAR